MNENEKLVLTDPSNWNTFQKIGAFILGSIMLIVSIGALIILGMMTYEMIQFWKVMQQLIK